MAHAQPTRFEPVREELEKVRLRFIRLLDEIPEEDWDRHFPGEGWTVKQEMVHIVQVLNILPNGIRRASSGGRRSFLAIVPATLRSWINGHIIIPLMARGATHQSIAEAYGKAHQALLGILEELPEDAWSKGMPYPRKYRTVEQMAHRPAEHFEEHLEHVQNVLRIKIEDSESEVPRSE
jgi:DinB superfamily